MSYWTAKEVLDQIAGELGLPRVATITGLDDVQSIQLLSLLNSGGNELLLYYPWEQLKAEWSLSTVNGQSDYTLPADYAYFIDQTQWDSTNQWPLLGPKTPQEWAWIKYGGVAAQPRQRFRVQGGKLKLHPTPGASVAVLKMEYMKSTWVTSNVPAPGTAASMITQDADVILYDPWLVIKFVKFKFYELKGMNTNGVNADFMRVFNALTGKDVGAQILSLSGPTGSPYLGWQNVPEGNWIV